MGLARRARCGLLAAPLLLLLRASPAGAAPLLAPMPPPPPPRPMLEVATSPDHPFPRLRPRVPPYPRPGFDFQSALAFRFAGGVARNGRAPDGYYGRIGTGALLGDSIRSGFFGGFSVDLEGWGARDSGGGSMPTELRFGAKAPVVMVAMGLGWSWLTIDRIEGDFRVGLVAPHLSFQAGLDLWVAHLLFDAKASYRWHFVGADTPQLQLGVLLEPLVW